MTRQPFIEIRQIESDRPTKTQRWKVVSRDDRHHLGIIKFHPAWRRYCFFPADGTLFDNLCMTMITKFIERESIKWREQHAMPKVKECRSCRTVYPSDQCCPHCEVMPRKNGHAQSCKCDECRTNDRNGTA